METTTTTTTPGEGAIAVLTPTEKTTPKKGIATTELYFGGATAATAMTIASSTTDRWVCIAAMLCATVIACWYVSARAKAKINGEAVEIE